MVKKLPPLNTLLAFESSARHNSFKRAGNELHQTPAAIAYQVKKLEGALQVTLFKRHHKGVELNATGQKYFNSIKHILNQLQAETESIRQHSCESTLRIVTLHAIAEKWLGPRLNGFRQQNPEPGIEIIAAESTADSSSADFVIGFSKTKPKNDQSTVFMQEQIFPVCSAEYLEKYQPALTSLHQQEILVDVSWISDWEHWLAINNLNHELSSRQTLSFSLYSMVIDAAVKGMGLMMGHEQLIKNELARGDLQPVFGETRSLRGYYVYQTGHDATQASQRFACWLNEMAHYQD